MLLKSCTGCHVLLSDVFSRSLPLWKEETKSFKWLQSWVKKQESSILPRKSLPVSFVMPFFFNLTCRSKSVFLHCLFLDSCCEQSFFSFFFIHFVPQSRPSISCVTFLTTWRVKLLWRSYEDEKLFVEHMALLLIASWHQHYFHTLVMLWEVSTSARFSFILQNGFSQVCCKKHEHFESLWVKLWTV